MMSTNQEILTKAIEQAIAGGWEAEPLGGPDVWYLMPDRRKAQVVHNIINQGSAVASSSVPIYIFNHDFAKALWGEEMLWWAFPDLTYSQYKLATWQYHLQQMVIAEDPIKYLGEHLDV